MEKGGRTASSGDDGCVFNRVESKKFWPYPAAFAISRSIIMFITFLHFSRRVQSARIFRVQIEKWQKALDCLAEWISSNKSL
jgi:hypothetical protein